MQKYSEVIGLPVICAEDGKKIGIVNDIVFLPKSREVKALVLERKGGQVRHKLIYLKDIRNIGTDAVVVNDCTCVTKDKNFSWLRNKEILRGLHIYSNNGADIGVVKDILFDYQNGCIEGFEISDGLLTDVIKGRRLIPLFGKVEFGEDSILVSNEAIEEISETGGGINNLLKDSGKSMS